MNIRHIWFVIICGTPGSGKSLHQAQMSYDFLKDYLRNEKKYPELKPRLLIANQTLNVPFIAEKLKVSPAWILSKYKKWRQPKEFRYCPRENCWLNDVEGKPHGLHDADLIVDEGSLLFPADGWADTPYWLRELLSEHRHRGIRIRMMTQDYSDIVIHARRKVKLALFMEKTRFASRDISASLPPVKHVWGWYTTQRIDPILIGSDSKALLNIKLSTEEQMQKYSELGLVGTRSLHWISRFKISLYDTTEKVDHYEVIREVEHIEAKCNKPGCDYLHKTHKLK